MNRPPHPTYLWMLLTAPMLAACNPPVIVATPAPPPTAVPGPPGPAGATSAQSTTSITGTTGAPVSTGAPREQDDMGRSGTGSAPGASATTVAMPPAASVPAN